MHLYLAAILTGLTFLIGIDSKFGADIEILHSNTEIKKKSTKATHTSLNQNTSSKTSKPLTNSITNMGNNKLAELVQVTISERSYKDTDDFRTSIGFKNNLTVRTDAVVYLSCRILVPNPSLQATWIRVNNWLVLSSGTNLYINDRRFRALHPEGSSDWILEIQHVQGRDSNSYICQIGSRHDLVLKQVHLNVVETKAVIKSFGNNAEYHVDVGSEISLICVIEHTNTKTPDYILWYRNDRMVKYDRSRKDILVETKYEFNQTKSQLLIRNAIISDTGNYTCNPYNVVPASIYVFVSEGDKMAAILRGKSTGLLIDSSILFQCLYFLTVWILR